MNDEVTDLLRDELQGAREDEGLGTLLDGEVAVAGAEGEAVFVAHDGAGDEVEGEVQVTGHLAQDGELGGVLLAEVGAVGCDDVK